MPKKGRPRKPRLLYHVKNWIEYTSDSDSDFNNVHRNVSYEINNQQQQTPVNAGRHEEGHEQQMEIGPEEENNEVFK